MKIVGKEELSPGDHIFSDRKFLLYDHHGIYVGDNMVIHLMGPKKAYDQGPCQKCGFIPQAGIFKTCLDCFLNGHSLYRYEYGVSKRQQFLRHRGSCTIEESKPANQVVESAHELLQEKNFGSYHFFLNNCEDFAVCCKTGVKMSNQTRGQLFGFNKLSTAVYKGVKRTHEAINTFRHKETNTQSTT